MGPRGQLSGQGQQAVASTCLSHLVPYAKAGGGAEPGEQQSFHSPVCKPSDVRGFGNTLVSHAALVINTNVNSVLGVSGPAKPFTAAVRQGGTMKSIWSLLVSALQAERQLAHTVLYW